MIDVADSDQLRKRRHYHHRRGNHTLCRSEAECRAGAPEPGDQPEPDTSRSAALVARWADRVPDDHAEVLDEAARTVDVLAAIDAALLQDPSNPSLLGARAAHSKLLGVWLRELARVAAPAEGTVPVDALIEQAVAELRRDLEEAEWN